MAITVTPDTGFPQRMGKRRISIGSILFDSSYPTGGEAITAANLGFTSIDNMSFAGGQKGLRFAFDKGNLKVMVEAPAFTRHCLNPAQATRNLAGAAGDVATFQHGRDLYVVGFSSVVTTALVFTTTSPCLSVEKRAADGSSTVVELATVTYVTADAVGVVDSYFTGAGAVGGGLTTALALATPYKIVAGETIVLKHKTQAVGGAIAGYAIGHIWVVDYDSIEECPNTFDLSGLTAVRYTAFGY